MLRHGGDAKQPAREPAARLGCQTRRGCPLLPAPLGQQAAGAAGGALKGFPSAFLGPDLSPELIPDSGLERGASPFPKPITMASGLPACSSRCPGRAGRPSAFPGCHCLLSHPTKRGASKVPAPRSPPPELAVCQAGLGVGTVPQAPARHRAAGHGAPEQPVLPRQTCRIKLSPALQVRSRRSSAGRGTSPKSMPPGTPKLQVGAWAGMEISSSVLSAGKYYL